ncbi:MAG: murein biosynthesis integral membrane protein MurJ [Proteobacteria bacterium]|nr:murein biosynthesis integral membrane protein MurJ [Pseudomonadota bacterium]MBU1570831.1 murein biosynthesis integral membrane protein MurJ [Pseudomonadota bacterium]
MPPTLYKKIGIASAIMMASVFFSRVIGLFREMAIAYAGGAGGDVDAYQIAFVIPEILNHIAASGFLSITFIPIFSNYLANNKEDEGWRVFSLIMTCFGGGLLFFILIAMILAPQLVSLIAPGLIDPQIFSKSVRMTRIILPAQFFFFLGGLLMAVQFSKERFTIPALAPLLYNIGIILGGMLLGSRFGMEGFSWGVLGGAFTGSFLLQYWGAKKAGMKFRISFNFMHPDLRKYVYLTLPLMFGLTMTFSTEFFLKFFGSFLPHGSIAALNYGLRIMFIMVGLFGQAVGMATYPFMARLVAENKIEEMNKLLNDTLRALSLVVPFSVLAMVLRHEIVLIIFQRGRFDAAATEFTSGLLIFLLAGTFAFAAQTVVVRGFYAMQNTLFPAVFGTLAVICSIPLYYYCMNVMGAGGIALAISLSAFLQVVLLYALWNRQSHNIKSRAVYLFFTKISLLSAVMGILFEWIKRRFMNGFDTSTFSGSLLISVLLSVLFAVVFVSSGYLLKIKEISEITKRIAGKIKKITAQ